MVVSAYYVDQRWTSGVWGGVGRRGGPPGEERGRRHGKGGQGNTCGLHGIPSYSRRSGLVCLLGEYDEESPECMIDERGRLEVLSNRSSAVCLTQCPMMTWCFQGGHSIIQVSLRAFCLITYLLLVITSVEYFHGRGMFWRER